LRNSFQKVEVSELSEGETLQILKTLIGTLEKTYKLYLSFPAIYAVINLSKRYITERRLPDSAVRTIESACSWAQNQGLGMLTADKVAEFISMQTNIPVDNISSKEAQELGSLEDRVKQKVIGQDEAVEKVVQTLKRARADIRDPDRPIGTFLFMGPTGVGKTHLAKIVTQEYFSKENTNERGMISVDMSEYKELSSLNRFLGTSSAAGGLEQSTVTLLDKVRANPYGVILFDEIEKAHPQILDLFLQLFEEGRLTSNRGETVDFRNMIIICTSNIGSQNLLQTLSSGATNWETAKEEALKDLKSEMKPELINRFDQVIVFSPHDKENLEKITVLLLNDLAKRMKEKGYSITWDEDVPMYIANTAYEPGFGARPLRRFIQDEVESLIANKIIDSQLNKGDSLRITKEWF
jgi:ATP-dependent Clp protease ATP-binding subunit ClpB